MGFRFFCLPNRPVKSILYKMRPQYPQTTKELQKMLHAGMGRAILFLLNQDLSNYHDMILDNCIHDYAYDQQVEEPHAEYLYPLIKASGEGERYSKEILQALLETENYFDAEQLLDFAVLFTKDGNEKAREAIYEKIRLNNTSEVLTGEDQAIKLDGVKGLLFVLDIIGRDPVLMSYRHHDLIIKAAEDVSSIEELRLALKQAALENLNIAAALSNMKNYSTDWTAEEIVQRREEKRESQINANGLSEDTTWEEVKNSPIFKKLIFRWSNLASDDEFLNAAQDLDINEKPEMLKFHLRAFWKRPFPIDPSRLISLLDHPDKMLGVAAFSALEIVQHDEVRDLFYRVREDQEWASRAIGLLRSNYQSGNYRIILDLLQKETNPDNLHAMCSDTMDVYRDNPMQEGLQPLLFAYEKTPCTNCRNTCIETILEISELPEWMIEECLYDAYSETRELAAKLKQAGCSIIHPQ